MATPTYISEPRTVGDTGTPFSAQIMNRDGTPRDLSDCDVFFKLVRDTDNAMQIDMKPAVVSDLALAIVEYWPTDDDVDVTITADDEPAGVRYAGWFVVVKDDKSDHYPPDAKTSLWIFHHKYT